MFCEVVLALCVVGQARFLGNVSCTRWWIMVVKKSTLGCSPLPVTVANEGHWEIYIMLLVLTVAGGDNPTSTVLLLMEPYLYLWSELVD